MAEDDRANAVNRLKTVRLFRALKDPVIEKIAGLFEWQEVPAGTPIVREGERGDYFYVIDQGRADVTHTGTRRGNQVGAGSRRRASTAPPQRLNVLHPGDYFGEGALLAGRRRIATVTAQTQMRVLRVDARGFDKLMALAPEIKPRLALDIRTHEIVSHQRLDWLEPNELVLIFATKHWYLLLPELAKSVGLLLVVTIVFAVVMLFTGGWLLAVYGYLLLITPLALWAAWQYVDWANDYYILTNRRVIHEERVLLLYEARIEAPLYTVRNVKVDVKGYGKIFDYGDVSVQTIAGMVDFHGVGSPQALSNLVMDLVQREKERQALTERTAIRNELLKQMGLPIPPPPAPEARPPRTSARGSLVAAQNSLLGLAKRLNLQTRLEAQDIITYRKHPWVLLQATGIPLLALLALAVLNLLRILGEFTGWLQFLPLNAVVCGIELVAVLPLAFWIWYQYEDWRNDIYQVTSDSIFDIERKPLLGQEERRQASLDAVLNVMVNRPNPIAIALNFGDVIVQTGGKTGEFTFNSVFDPLGVQQDLWRKFEQLQTRKREGEATRRRAEMAEWFAVFHRVLQEYPPGE